MTLLLLHGFAGTWRAFEHVLRHLPSSIRASALTQRATARRASPRYHLNDWVADLAAYVDALRPEFPVVVGHSMGSAVALRWGHMPTLTWSTRA